MRVAALPVLALLATPAFAQSDQIPAPVIAQCNETASASELPDCLKHGAIAFEMFERARSEAYYGAAAEPVIAACGERNTTYHKQWICFENAAEKAAEVRKLIGVENITDACVAGLSDAELAARIAMEHGQLRAQRFPGQTFYGGDMYFPFQGCPAPEEGASLQDTPSDEAPPPTGETAKAAVGPASGTAEEDILSGEGCAVFGEIETIVRDSDADALREIGADMRALEDPTPSDIARATGLSEAATVHILSSGERRAMGAAEY